jgi:hypothetical protein
MSRTEWARAHGIDGRSLRAWSMNLAARASGQRRGRARRSTSAVRMVELVPPSTAVVARWTIRCGAYALEVSDAVDDATLRQVLRALREC